MTIVYRSMKDDGEGMPLCGASVRTLGVRREGDVSPTSDGIVEPATGGMSVAFGKLRNLPRHRRPSKHGGFGEDPVWKIDLDDYQVALAASRAFWELA